MKYTTGHKIYYNDNMEEIPSATTILKILNKPSLIGWANYLGKTGRNVKDVLTYSSNLGTTVHSIIENIVCDEKKPYIHTSTIFTKHTIYKCIDNFLKWYKNNTVEYIFTEKSFSSTLFGGTVDFYGKVNNKYTIVDYKTSKQIRLSMFIQLAMYTILLEENGYEVESVGIVLANDKKPDNKFINREDLNKYIDMAKQLISLFHIYYNINETDKWKENIIEEI